MKTLIKSSTTSMTSVPKPLKFLRPQYARIKAIYQSIQNESTKVSQIDRFTYVYQASCAEVVSVVGMTMADDAECKHDTLNYRLLSKRDDIGAWGHEYVRHLTNQIVELWVEGDLSGSEEGSTLSAEAAKQKSDYTDLVEKIIPYLMEHNAESEAIDLCIEIEQLHFLEKHTTQLNFQRVCLYLTSCVAYIPDPDNTKVLRCAETLYRKYYDLGNAMRCALRLNDAALAQSIFNDATSLPVSKTGVTGTDVRRQLAYLLGKHQFITPYDEALAEEDEDLAEMLGNTRLSEHFLSLGRELDIMDPKVCFPHQSLSFIRCLFLTIRKFSLMH